MKTRIFIIIAIGILPFIPLGFSQCIENEDWSRAPCLDVIANGWYGQDQVDRWSEYYSYKGSEIMESKYLELSDAIKENRIEEWTRESHENLNVYQYYFFSGRAPNTGEYHGNFYTIKIDEPTGIPNKPHFLNLQPIFSFGPILFIDELIITGIIGGIIVGVIFWRKRK